MTKPADMQGREGGLMTPVWAEGGGEVEGLSALRTDPPCMHEYMHGVFLHNYATSKESPNPLNNLPFSTATKKVPAVLALCLCF